MFRTDKAQLIRVSVCVLQNVRLCVCAVKSKVPRSYFCLRTALAKSHKLGTCPIRDRQSRACRDARWDQNRFHQHGHGDLNIQQKITELHLGYLARSPVRPFVFLCVSLFIITPVIFIGDHYRSRASTEN